MKAEVVVRSVKGRRLDEAVSELLERLDWTSVIKEGSSVVIKLNLCEFDPKKVASANTSPELVRSLCSALKKRTSDITLVEAHSYRAPAELAFESTGIYRVAEEVGVNIVNLSKAKCIDICHPLLGTMPEILFKADVFITMPVLKTHALTYFTGALKNQWGCVPRYDRISLHHSLDQLLVDLNHLLKPKLSIMDGILCMEGRGPTNGKPRRLDIIIGSKDPVALDATAMRLTGLDPNKCRHVVMAYNERHGLFREDEIELDMDVKRNWDDFEPARLDWAVDWMNRLTRYEWFRKYILGVDAIFYPVKKVVGILRRLGIVR